MLEQNGWIDSCITIEELQHVVVQWRFIGLAAAFVAISSAIARILGDFQKGASDVQEVAGSAAKTLKMPIPATEFIALIILEMTTVFGAYLLQILLGLATIIEVLRFQLIRIREVAAEREASALARATLPNPNRAGGTACPVRIWKRLESRRAGSRCFAGIRGC